MAEKFDFSLDLGSDEDVIIDFHPSNVPFPLDGWVIEVQLRKRISDAAPSLTLTSTNGRVVISGARLILRFLYSEFSGLSGSYVYDVLATNTNVSPTAKRRIAEGVISMNPATTR